MLETIQDLEKQLELESKILDGAENLLKGLTKKKDKVWKNILSLTIFLSFCPSFLFFTLTNKSNIVKEKKQNNK